MGWSSWGATGQLELYQSNPRAVSEWTATTGYLGSTRVALDGIGRCRERRGSSRGSNGATPDQCRDRPLVDRCHSVAIRLMVGVGTIPGPIRYRGYPKSFGVPISSENGCFS